MMKALSKIPPEIIGLRFTDVERRIMEELSDGELHTDESLTKCLYAENGSVNSVRVKVKYIRDKIRDSRYRICTEDVVVECRFINAYRLVMFLPTAK